MLEAVECIQKDELIKKVNEIKKQGHRLAAITCEEEKEAFEIIYHFDYEYKMKNLKLILIKGEEVESISSIYQSSYLVENEIQDLYGIKFNNLSIDYKGYMYLTENSPKAPFTQEKGE